jgi:hypothetical protein
VRPLHVRRSGYGRWQLVVPSAGDRVAKPNAQAMRDIARSVLRSSCVLCDFDEAEGDVINHCDVCCRRITTELWALFMLGRKPPQPRSPL